MSKYQALIDALEAPGLSDFPWLAFGPSNGAAPPDHYYEVVAVRSDAQVQVICQAPRGLDVACTADMNYIAEANPSTIRALLADLEGAKKALAALAQQAQEPITVEAVAEVVDRRDGEGDRLDWLIEGGIDALPTGVVLMMSHRPITNNDGHGEVYTTPPASQEQADEIARLKRKISNLEEGLSAYHKLLTDQEQAQQPTPPAPQVPAPVDEREAFELWLTTEAYYSHDLRRTVEGPYVNDEVDHAWDAWQARAALQSPAPQTKDQP